MRRLKPPLRTLSPEGCGSSHAPRSKPGAAIVAIVAIAAIAAIAAVVAIAAVAALVAAALVAAAMPMLCVERAYVSGLAYSAIV